MTTLASSLVTEQLQEANNLLNRQSAELATRVKSEYRQRMVAEGLQEILAVLNSNRPLGEVLDYIATLAARLLESDACAVYTFPLDPSPENASLADQLADQLVVQASHGFDPAHPPVSPIAVGEGIIGQSVEINMPMALVDTDRTTPDGQSGGNTPPPQSDKRQEPAEIDQFYRQIQNLHRAILAVPLKIADETRGCIVLYYLYPTEISDEAVALAMSFGTQVALAVENARQRQESLLLATLEERARLARELHDSVTQSLYSLNLFAETGRVLASQGNMARTEHYLARIGETTQQALKEMRLLVYELRPVALLDESLSHRLRRRMDTVENRAGVVSRLVITRELTLPSTMEPEIFRIIQEALNNALKHAKAKNLIVGIEWVSTKTDPIFPHKTGYIEITITDDGQGFDVASLADSGGLGMHSMRERTALLGGEFSVTSTPGEGTTIQTRIPLDIDPS